MQGFTSLLLQENQNQMEDSESADLEALSTNELLNYIIYHDTLIYPSPPPQIAPLPVNNDKDNVESNDNHNNIKNFFLSEQPVTRMKRKRRRRAKVCKNKEEAERQRMTHIAVERNRRKQMNGHLAVLRSLMPDSYIQRGDQASIVGGAIEYVKELEHLLQTLESQKLLLHHGVATTPSSTGDILAPQAPFSQFFSHPQYTWTTNTNTMNSNIMNNNTSVVNNNYKYSTTSSSSKSNDLGDIEVSLIETHANIRILSRRSFSQLSKMVAAFHSFSLSILHLNVTTLDPLVLYSISAKVEEGCQLTSADDIAGAVHHMLRIIEEEAAIC